MSQAWADSEISLAIDGESDSFYSVAFSSGDRESLVVSIKHVPHSGDESLLCSKYVSLQSLKRLIAGLQFIADTWGTEYDDDPDAE